MEKVRKYKGKLKIIQFYMYSIAINWVNKQKRKNKKRNQYQIHTVFVSAIKSCVT